MMRKFVSLMIVMVVVTSAKAQWSLKPEAGIMLVKSENNYKWDNRFTAGLGAEYEWKAGGLDLGLQSGLYYTQRGFNRGYTFSDHVFYADINRGFLQLPVKMNVYVPICDNVRLMVGAGPYLAYDVNTSWGFSYGNFPYGSGGYGNNGTTYDPAKHGKPAIRKWDYGLGANVALEIKNFILGVAYDMSFGKEVKSQKSGLQYHNLTFTAGYRFKVGK